MEYIIIYGTGITGNFNWNSLDSIEDSLNIFWYWHLMFKPNNLTLNLNSIVNCLKLKKFIVVNMKMNGIIDVTLSLHLPASLEKFVVNANSLEGNRKYFVIVWI